MDTDDTELSARLRQLPALEPPPGAWMAIEDALQRRARVSTAPRWQAAAVLLLMLLALAVAQPWSANRQMVPLLAATDPALEELMARSQHLEAVLQQLPRPAVEQAGATLAIDELQARIQQLDAQLSTPDAGSVQARLLWDERVQLMSSLVGVRYVESMRRAGWMNNDNGEFR